MGFGVADGASVGIGTDIVVTTTISGCVVAVGCGVGVPGSWTHAVAAYAKLTASAPKITAVRPARIGYEPFFISI